MILNESFVSKTTVMWPEMAGVFDSARVELLGTVREDGKKLESRISLYRPKTFRVYFQSYHRPTSYALICYYGNLHYYCRIVRYE
jgi:hypothetical protein